MTQPSSDIHTYKYTAVIPIFNSEAIVNNTIDRTTQFFEQHDFDYELILVNDGSTDKSWQCVEEKAEQNPHIVAIDLLRNYGQHSALYCGFQHSTGDYLITLDDDLQNPPEEIIHLINKMREDNYDVVYGKFHTKQHAQHRRLGSRAIALINQRIFHQPKDLTLTNFRIIRRDVVERISAYQTSYPYISGLTLIFSSKRANVLVEHHARKVGKSSYNFFRIAALVTRILFNYSAAPLHFVSVIGALVSLFSLIVGTFYILHSLIIGINVPGWTTLIVLLSFFNGINLMIMSMLGEYMIRIVNQMSYPQSYSIKKIVKHDV